jgi:hypothetical protein
MRRFSSLGREPQAGRSVDRSTGRSLSLDRPIAG